jgi:DNA polymerase
VYTGDYGQYLAYKSVPDAQVWARFVSEKEQGKPNTTYIVDEPGNSREWCRISTYGGKLSENITQAICRDLLAEAMLRVEAAGYQIVLTVHDEIVCEGAYAEADRAHFERLMTAVPAWAKGFPIAAGCWRSERYIKG